MATVQRSRDPRLIGYPHRLNWYDVPPPYEITLEEFEVFALDRLHVLKAIETAQVRNIKKDDELRVYLKDIMKKFLPLGQNSRDIVTDDMRKTMFRERKKDHVSHFLLRLAYCRTPDLRSWFLKMETELFRVRLLEENSESRTKFLKQSDVELTPIDLRKVPSDPAEKLLHNSLIRDLAALTGVSEKEVLQNTYFKVDFLRVLDLVQRRSVVVRQGFAYVPAAMQTVLVVNEFKERLNVALETTAKALPRMDEDDRLNPILYSISKQYVSARSGSYTSSDPKADIKHTDIESLADPHMPLCMRTLHLHLRQEGHLKHNARLQYNLFLKGIGLPLEEALMFWRKAFHKMTDDKYQKGGYAYNIRHGYGMEGKRTNYTPYSCMKIITTNHPGAGEHHGCPFKHYGTENLRSLLTQTLVKTGEAQSVSNSVNELLKMVNDGHYQVACTRLFELTHRGKGGERETVDTIDHPNMWFELSYEGAVKRRTRKVVSKSKTESHETPIDEFNDIEMTDADFMEITDFADDAAGEQ